MTPAIVAALVLLVGSAAAAVSFVSMSGGLVLAGPNSSNVATASPSPAPSATASAETPTVGPTSTPVAEPTSTAGASPTAGPTPRPTAGPTPLPSSDRYALLTPCPNKPDCYLYTVRAGDNLMAIANYFGVLYDTVLSLNPEISDPTKIHAGDVLVLPPPTR